MTKEQEEEITEILNSILEIKDEYYEMGDLSYTSWCKDFVRIVVEDTDGGRYIINGPFKVKESGPELICTVLTDD